VEKSLRRTVSILDVRWRTAAGWSRIAAAPNARDCCVFPMEQQNIGRRAGSESPTRWNRQNLRLNQ
jgi:hypothetical protein